MEMPTGQMSDIPNDASVSCSRAGIKVLGKEGENMSTGDKERRGKVGPS